METKHFKTNASCSGCASRISKSLSKLVSESQFSIDVTHPDSILTITSELSNEQIIDAVKEAGYYAEFIS